jgi:uncharacterized surface protein with fasciclin (FAS1) repeats
MAFIFAVGVNFAQAQDATVVDIINESEDHTILAELLVETELNNVISQPGSFTVIAPTDEAFEALGSDLDELRANPQQLQNVVIGHLYQGEVPSEDVEPNVGVEVVEGDISASNGIVHVTDEVVMTE